MKSLTPSSSVKSSATITTMDENQSEARDSCYYPGCKKDANCNCEICIASINATLDLMPFSVQKSSLTKLSASRGPNNVKSTPVSFEASVVSTPRSSSCKIMESPVLKSTARVNVKVNLKEMEKKETHNGFGFLVVFSKLVLVFSLFFAVEFGVSWTISGALKPDLSSDIVRNLGERSYFVLDLNGRLRFLQNELRGLVAHGKIFNCSCTDSKWEINQVLPNSLFVIISLSKRAINCKQFCFDLRMVYWIRVVCCINLQWRRWAYGGGLCRQQDCSQLDFLLDCSLSYLGEWLR